jgi:hypothetical protein
MDAAMLREYQRRWAAVAEVEAGEQQKQLAAQRWQQLNAIVRLAQALALTAADAPAEQAVIWQRWNRLKELYLVGLERVNRGPERRAGAAVRRGSGGAAPH